jgi:hypothetical protein
MIIHNPILTGSFTVNGVDALSITSSAANITSLNAATASLNSFSASVLTFTASAATTGSNTFVGNQVVSGSLTVTGSITTPGTLTAQTLVVQTITSSVDFVTGSTRFGSTGSNTHVFTGSMSVSGSGTFAGNISLGAASGFPSVGLLNRSSDSNLYMVAASSGFILLDNSQNTMYQATPTAHNWNISNSLKMTLNSSGSIGIGTTSPEATLPTGSSVLINNGWTANSTIIASRKIVEINSNDNNGGNVGLFLRQLNKSVGLDIWADNYYGNAYVDSRYDSADAYISFRLRTNTQANIVNAMVIKANGNVGIGTTNPLSPLYVVRDVDYTAPSTTGNAQGHFIVGRTVNSGLAIGSKRGSGTSGYTWLQAQILDAAQYNNDIVLQPNGGSVGVGTTPATWSTGANLEIGSAGNLALHNSNAVGNLIAFNTYYNSDWYRKTTSVSLGYIQDSEGHKFYFNGSGTGGTTFTPNERMRINSGGDIDFKTYTPNTGLIFKMSGGDTFSTLNGASGTPMYLNYFGNGAIRAGTGGGTTLYAGSDVRIKENINSVESILDKVLQLTPKTFNYKDIKDNKLYYGFVAQDMEEIFPELVRTAEGISMCNDEEIVDQKSIESYSLVWASILTKAIQELKAEVDALKAQ